MKGQLRNPFLAGVLSALLPGTGQIYNQEVLKGWIILIVFTLLLGTIFGSIAVWIFAIIDAFVIAGKINRWQKRMTLERNSVYAVISSLICGWGQIYNGQLLKGILMLICFIVMAPTGIGLIVMLLYGVFDAYYTAEKINKGEQETPLIRGIVYHYLDILHSLLERETSKKTTFQSSSNIIIELKEKINLALERNDCTAALTYGKLALQKGGKDDPELHSQLGKIYLSLGNYSFSSLEFIHAFELGDKSVELCNNLSLSLLNYGRNSKDDTYFQLAGMCLSYAMDNMESNNTFWQWDINHINLLILKGELEGAKKRARFLVDRKPELWQANHCLGLVLLIEGKRLEAKDIFMNIIKKNPNAWESRVALARICEEEKSEGQALTLYKELIGLKPPERIIRGVNYRIKRLSSPERKFLRMFFREKEII